MWLGGPFRGSIDLGFTFRRSEERILGDGQDTAKGDSQLVLAQIYKSENLSLKKNM